MPLTPKHRDGSILDLVLTKSEHDVDDVNVDAPNILSVHSLISWRVQLTYQALIIAYREVRARREWTRTCFGRCSFSQSFASVHVPFFDVYHNTLKSLASEFAPVRRVTIRRQRLTVWLDEECIKLRQLTGMLERSYRRIHSSRIV